MYRNVVGWDKIGLLPHQRWRFNVIKCLTKNHKVGCCDGHPAQNIACRIEETDRQQEDWWSHWTTQISKAIEQWGHGLWDGGMKYQFISFRDHLSVDRI